MILLRTRQKLSHNARGVLLVGNAGSLTVGETLIVVLFDRQVDRVSWKLSFGPRNVGSDTASHDGDDTHIERRQLDSECVAVAVESRFGGVVDGAKDVGNDTRHTADLDNSSLCVDQERREDLAQPHDGEDVGFVGQSDLRWFVRSCASIHFLDGRTSSMSTCAAGTVSARFASQLPPRSSFRCDDSIQFLPALFTR